VRGLAVDWAAVLGASGRRIVPLPTYAFDRLRAWPDGVEAGAPLAWRGATRDTPPPPTAGMAGPAAPRELQALDGDPLDVVVREAAEVLGHASPDTLDRSLNLLELGFTSLGAVELQNRLEPLAGGPLEGTGELESATLSSLAEELIAVRSSGVDESAKEQESRDGSSAQPVPAAPERWPFLDVLRMAHASGRLADSVPLLVAAAELAHPPGDGSRVAGATLVSQGAAAPTLVCVPLLPGRLGTAPVHPLRGEPPRPPARAGTVATGLRPRDRGPRHLGRGGLRARRGHGGRCG